MYEDSKGNNVLVISSDESKRLIFCVNLISNFNSFPADFTHAIEFLEKGIESQAVAFSLAVIVVDNDREACENLAQIIQDKYFIHVLIFDNGLPEYDESANSDWHLAYQTLGRFWGSWQLFRQLHTQCIRTPQTIPLAPDPQDFDWVDNEDNIPKHTNLAQVLVVYKSNHIEIFKDPWRFVPDNLVLILDQARYLPDGLYQDGSVVYKIRQNIPDKKVYIQIEPV